MKKAKLVKMLFTQEEIAKVAEENIKLKSENDKLKADIKKYVNKIKDLKLEDLLLKKRVINNDAIIDELLVAEEGTDIQGILEKNYEFSYFNGI